MVSKHSGASSSIRLERRTHNPQVEGSNPSRPTRTLELKLFSSSLSSFVVHAVHALVAEYYESIPIPEPNEKVDDGPNCEPESEAMECSLLAIY